MNGSTLRTLVASEAIRGVKVHGGIIDIDIDKKIRNEVIEPMIRPLYIRHYKIMRKLFKFKDRYESADNTLKRIEYVDIMR